MAEFGLSPAVLVGATCGLQLLFDRFDYDDSDAYRALRRDEHVFDSAEQGVRLTFEAHRHAFVPTTMLLAQMSTTPGLPADAREPMLSWVVAACEDTPQFIRAISWTWILCEPPSSSSARNAMSGPWS